METANDKLIADVIDRTGDAALEAAAAQLHTTAWWLATTETIVIARARYAEARATIQARGGL